MPEVQLRIPVRCPAGPVRSHGFLVPKAAARDSSALEGLQGGAPDLEAHRAPTPPKWPGSLATSCWPSWTALGPCRGVFFCLFQFSPCFVFFYALAKGGGRGLGWGRGKGRFASRGAIPPSRGPALRTPGDHALSLPGEEGDEGVRSSAGARVPVRSRAWPGTGRGPASCRVGRGHQARGLVCRAWWAIGTPAAAMSGGTRGSCCEGARASQRREGLWPRVPSPSEQTRVRPGRSRRPGSHSRPAVLCVAARPGQSQDTLRSPTPPQRPPPPPPIPTPACPGSGTQLRGRWRPSRRAPRRCSGRLIHGMCNLVTPCQGGPRPSRSRRPRAGGKGPGRGGRSPSPGPRNAIGSSCRASVHASPGSWQRLVARAPRDPGCTCPAGDCSRGRGPGGQRSGAFADSAFLANFPRRP